jgi:hypothetical protein
MKITQEELRTASQLEEAYAKTRALIRRKVKAGAICEDGDLAPDAGALLVPLPRLVKKARPESLPMAVLSFRELRMLQDFCTLGRFYPREIREILDRFEREGRRIFRADRERMRVSADWNVSKHLLQRLQFAYHIRRGRLLVRLHEMGLFNATGGIVEEIYKINRQYFRDRSDALPV